jgi:hypothetical protein
MRIKAATAWFLLVCVTIIVPTSATSGEKPKKEVFSALAQLPVAGSTANVKIYIDGYSSPQDAERLNSTLLSGGPAALLKALKKLKSLGRIEGRVGWLTISNL